MKKKILMVSPECAPFSKVGGLADMVSSISKQFAEDGCEVKKNLDNIATSRYESYTEFVEEAKEYKEKIKYEGKKKETFEKQHHNKSAVKISAQKRQASRRTMKQQIDIEEEN